VIALAIAEERIQHVPGGSRRLAPEIDGSPRPAPLRPAPTRVLPEDLAHGERAPQLRDERTRLRAGSTRDEPAEHDARALQRLTASPERGVGVGRRRRLPPAEPGGSRVLGNEGDERGQAPVIAGGESPEAVPQASVGEDGAERSATFFAARSGA
jgi:hypothetical protein